MANFRVAICGGGIAGVEGLLRLRRLAGDDVDVTLICPADELVYRPLTVLEPFATAQARRYPLARIIGDTGARWERASLSWLDRSRRVVHASDGREIAYDALLLAIGAQELAPSPHVHVFTGRDGGESYRRVLDNIEARRITKLAFVVNPGPSWPLPLIEVALLTADHARRLGRRVELSLIIPDAQPLPALGGQAGDIVTGLLGDAGITLHPNTRARTLSPRRLELEPGGGELHPDLIVSVPRISGPDVRGVPGYAIDRFVHVDEYCRVRDTDGHMFAAGDATDLLVKHGGIGAQQADTAAAGIAYLAGLGPAPEPLRPRVDATLLTATGPLYFSAHLIVGQGWRARVHEQPPWGADEKVVAAELGPYLRNVDTFTS